MGTLAVQRTDLRAKLDETSARFWSDAQLTNFLNEGATDVARRAEVLLDMRQIPLAVGVKEYLLPTNVFRLHRATATVDGGTTVYPLEFRDLNELDEIAGTRPNTQQYVPSFLTTRGYTPNLYAVLFPVPAAVGTLTVFYYRTPVIAVNDADPIDVPTGWDDLPTLYAEYVALRKDADPRWSEAKGLYEERLDSMIATTRQAHDQGRYVVQGTNMLPWWIYGDSY